MKPLMLLQVNVGRGGPSHELALSLSNEEQMDVILIQEPYIFRERERRITKRHPSYEVFTPIDDWTSARPRVLTYVRKGVGLRTEQIRPSITEQSALRDLLFLQVTSSAGLSLLIANVYNAPIGASEAGTAVKALTLIPQTFFSQPSFIAGDFNLHHKRWQPSLRGNPTAFAESFVTWLDRISLIFISEIDRPTHNKTNVLDLSFTTGGLAAEGASTLIAPYLDVTSDHLPLVTSIPWDQRFQEPIQRLRPDSLDEPLFLSLLASNCNGVSPSSKTLTTEDLDSLALAIVKAVKNAYEGSAKRSLGQGMGNPWWNDDCKNALQSIRAARRTPSTTDPALQSAQKGLRNAVRTAKRAFWREKIDNVTSAKEVFDMSKWHKSTGSYRSPPLKDLRFPDDPPASSLSAKRDVLVGNLLQNMAEVGDIPANSPAVPRGSLSFFKPTLEDIQEAILRANNTAPGADEITTRILQAAWPLIKTLVLSLFQGCLQIGHHPECFRSAVLAILQKPNKPDRSSPRSYRPIALLSVLGKGLERFIARQMSWIAVRYRVLASQQFGALPLRSSVDLTTCLTHDVEEALNSKLTATLLTLDIKGAFDAVLPGRLVRRLREQGWQDNLVRWVASFATGRSVQVRLDGETGPPTDVSCGLPQGSPVSPILFMLYIAPLFHMGRPRARFGYADDVALLATSASITTNCEILSQHLAEALDWGTSEGITFDPGKSELLHFSRRRTDRDAASTPSVSAGPVTVSENPTRPYLKWLGVLFDRKLSFKWHVQELSSKALIVSNALRSLGNTARGVPPYLLRQASTACVLRRAYFAAETWWPGRTRPGATGPISNQVEGLLQCLSKVVLTSARAILPVYKTTPIAVLYRECGLLPPEIELNLLAQTAAARLRRLDPRHPLRKRAEKIIRLGRPTSRFARRVLALPASEQVDPLAHPPWHPRESRDKVAARIGAPRGLTKEQAALSFQEFYQSIPPNDITLFSDGSKREAGDGSAGAGFVAYQAGRRALNQHFSLGPYAEVFDAEASAALAGVKAALALPTARYANDLWVFLDNLEVAMRLLSKSTGSSQSIFDSFCIAAHAWQQRERLPHTQPGAVRVRWVPGHSSVPGNEEADQAAKAGAALPHPPHPTHSLASLKRLAKSSALEASNTLWTLVAPQPYRDLGITTAPRKPSELNLPRPLLGRILASRTGHGDFADYHERFNHEDANLHCRCGKRKSTLHFFFCRIAKRRARRPPGPPSEVIAFLLGSGKGARTLAAWLAETRFYEDICPRNPVN